MIERSFRIDEAMYEQLKEISERENLPVSYLVRVAISQFLNAYSDSIDLMKINASALQCL